MLDTLDCRQTDPLFVKSVHFTVCQKPWDCAYSRKVPSCEHFVKEWYKLRKAFREAAAFVEPCTRAQSQF
ncbi:hypothetical protein Naga_100001g114 [Nannochloropsis gaditana]|uniref:Uncharacterized protein n=1 Tax=Nannochloropsis gaditana TaxID=72520 RepID=W7TI64_9STRA|nr:hypothetical protein Naga_100001g114 [Nannochloropsis gaditana]